jgi:hypothetical protein
LLNCCMFALVLWDLGWFSRLVLVRIQWRLTGFPEWSGCACVSGCRLLRQSGPGACVRCDTDWRPRLVPASCARSFSFLILGLRAGPREKLRRISCVVDAVRTPLNKRKGIGYLLTFGAICNSVIHCHPLMSIDKVSTNINCQLTYIFPGIHHTYSKRKYPRLFLPPSIRRVGVRDLIMHLLVDGH